MRASWSRSSAADLRTNLPVTVPWGSEHHVRESDSSTRPTHTHPQAIRRLSETTRVEKNVDHRRFQDKNQRRLVHCATPDVKGRKPSGSDCLSKPNGATLNKSATNKGSRRSSCAPRAKRSYSCLQSPVRPLCRSNTRVCSSPVSECSLLFCLHYLCRVIYRTSNLAYIIRDCRPHAARCLVANAS